MPISRRIDWSAHIMPSTNDCGNAVMNAMQDGRYWSYRELSEQTGFRESTICNALKRLLTAQQIEQAKAKCPQSGHMVKIFRIVKIVRIVQRQPVERSKKKGFQ